MKIKSILVASALLMLSVHSLTKAESSNSGSNNPPVHRFELVASPTMIHQVTVEKVLSTKIIRPSKNQFGDRLAVVLLIGTSGCVNVHDAKILISGEPLRGSREVVHLFALRGAGDQGLCAGGPPPRKLTFALDPNFMGPSMQEFVLPGSFSQLYKNGKTIIQIRIDSELGRILSVKVKK